MKMKSSGVRRSAEARNECVEKNWVETRHTKCMEDENKQKAEENPQKEEKEDSEHKRLQNIVKNLMPLPEQKKSAAKSQSPLSEEKTPEDKANKKTESSQEMASLIKELVDAKMTVKINEELMA